MAPKVDRERMLELAKGASRAANVQKKGPPIARRLEANQQETAVHNMALEGRALLLLPSDAISAPKFVDRIDASFSDAKFNELKESIRSNGQLQPVSVRELEPGKYQLIIGRRRLAACKALGIDVKCVLLDIETDYDLISVMVAENEERSNISNYERALNIVEWEKADILTTDQIEQILKVKKSTISKLRKLATVPQEVLEFIGDPRELSLNAGYDLATDCEKYREKLQDVLRELDGYANSDTNKRVERIRQALKSQPAREVKVIRSLSTSDGFKFATVTKQGEQQVIRFSAAVPEQRIQELTDKLIDWFEQS